MKKTDLIQDSSDRASKLVRTITSIGLTVSSILPLSGCVEVYRTRRIYSPTRKVYHHPMKIIIPRYHRVHPPIIHFPSHPNPRPFNNGPYGHPRFNRIPRGHR